MEKHIEIPDVSSVQCIQQTGNVIASFLCQHMHKDESEYEQTLYVKWHAYHIHKRYISTTWLGNHFGQSLILNCELQTILYKQLKKENKTNSWEMDMKVLDSRHDHMP